jgi:hypothetical protein
MLDKLQDSLKKGRVRFSFRKVDGSVREAYGTLHPSLLPPPSEISGSRPPQPQVQVYFDIDAASFRSFKKENLLSIGDAEVINSPIEGLPTSPENNPTAGLPTNA